MEKGKLLGLNQSGLIPGPGESEEEFLKRSEYCLGLHNHISRILPEADQAAPLSQNILAESDSLTTNLYDFSCKWIPLYFSNRKLSYWHGGCAWIFQETKDSPTGAILQLRKALAFSDALFFGLYKRKELIAHELAHAGRMQFQEPKYEELLAYQTSSSTFQRNFGPIVQSSAESMIFLLVLLMIFLLDLFILFSPEYLLLGKAAWLKLLPLAMVVYAWWRLSKRHKQFNSCLKQLQAICEHPYACIYRLTDHEIDLFAEMTPKQILDHASQQSELRWQLIKEAYIKSTYGAGGHCPD